MAKQIAIIIGYPDPGGDRLGHALAQVYAEGAETAEHLVKRIDIAQLAFPVLRTQEDLDHGALWRHSLRAANL